MAYDNYRGSPGSYEQPASQDEFSEPKTPHSASYIPPYPFQYTSDQVRMPQPRMPSSQPHPPLNTQGHLNDAVASIVNKAEKSGYLAPEVISLITATVIQLVKAYGLDNSQGQQQQHQTAPPPQASTYTESSASGTGQNTHTPPSSERHEFDSSPLQNRITQPSRTSPRPAAASAPERKESPSSQHCDHGQKEFRPKAPARVSTTSEMTTLEKVWGKLFEDGKPTERLGQFLRGIAVHLIENYPPGNTIVVVPEKMQKFYEDTKVPSDTYPWQDIFDDRTSSISKLYREVEAEHHLVQEKLNERPDIPGLTPRGFERWATLMIQAYPDREYARLQKAVLDMPISNPDDKKERFPKEIPRRLFPSSPDPAVREKLERSIITHCRVDLPPITVEERPKNPPRRNPPVEKISSAASTDGISSSGDHDNQTRSRSSSAVVDEDDEAIPPRPIERERKPYTAQPGGGKVYDDVVPRPASAGAKGKEYLSTPTSAPGHRESYSYGHLSPSTKNGRTRSSSFGVSGSGDYRHSESDLLGHDGSHGYGGLSSTSSTSAFPGDVIEDRRRYRDYDRDEGRTYDALRERERERERRYRDDDTWSDEDYYRGLLGGQGGGSGGYDYKTSWSGYR
ncbi:hypothetical protein VTN77DRAFT_5628 [Rasamsonia byssochlamydoides]|uniref:uncharacterized protein n=1 Tax=Rasamsonia byssochlamydoides TaxID=89139 RepID=UPI0037430582